MIEAVNVMERNYQRALPYEKERFDGNSRRKHKKGEILNDPITYLIRDRITIKLNEMA